MTHPIDIAAARARVSAYEYGLLVELEGLRLEGWTRERILALVETALRDLTKHAEKA